MAVTTTIQNIIDGGFSKSTQSQPGTSAGDPELVVHINNLLRGLYSFAAAINPNYFSAIFPVVGSSSVWARPEAAESIVRVETLTFGKVVIVPIDDRLGADPVPSLYEFGGNFTASEGQTLPPGASVTLNFWASKRPDDSTPSGVTGVLDPDWNETYNELLFLELAVFLALKDGRLAEADAMKVERNSWASRFGTHLQNATPALQRRLGHRKHVNVDSLLSMLTGGA